MREQLGNILPEEALFRRSKSEGVDEAEGGGSCECAWGIAAAEEPGAIGADWIGSDWGRCVI